MTSPKPLRWRALPAPIDVSSSPLPIVKMTVQDPVKKLGFPPCRRCLQDAARGDEMLLISYDPFLGDSPYRQPGPIFVHASPQCELASQHVADVQVPDQQRLRTLSVRAFNQDHAMVKCEVIEGTELAETSAKYLEDPNTEYVHVHYAQPGCFAVRIERDS